MKQKKIIVGQDVSGKNIEVTAYTFKGTKKNTPSVYSQASMHGAELQGNLVIHELMKELNKNPPLGDITLVPHCNPFGGNFKMGEYTYGRFDPISGDNWNRQYFNATPFVENFAQENFKLSNNEIISNFKEHLLNLVETEINEKWKLTRGEFMARKLQSLSCQADIILDLHTDSNSSRYVYSASYAEESARTMGLPNIILIENSFDGAMDEASFSPWWTLSDKLLALGKTDFINPVEAYTFEFGSQEIVSKPQAIEDTLCILRYLDYKKVTNSGNYVKQKYQGQSHNYDNFIVYYAPLGGLYEFLVKPGEAFKQDQPLARCTQLANELDQVETIIKAPFNGILVAHFDSSAITQGAKLANLFRVK